MMANYATREMKHRVAIIALLALLTVEVQSLRLVSNEVVPLRNVLYYLGVAIPSDLQNMACDISGIECTAINDEEATVTGISIHNLKPESSIHPDINQLTNLEVIDFNKHQFTDAIPDELMQLPKLKKLILSRVRNKAYNKDNNGFSGSIPSSISNLVQLEELDLTNNRLVGGFPATISQLTNLKKVVIVGNEEFSCTLDWLKTSSSNLTDLTVRNCDCYSNIGTSLASQPSLVNVDLAHNQFSGSITEIASMPALKTIDLSFNKLSGVVPDLSSLNELRSINLGFNEFSGSLPVLPDNIEYINFMNNKFSGPLREDYFKQSIKTMILARNQLTGTIPADIANATNLKHLEINNNQLNGTLPSEINFTKLQYLDVSYNRLTGPFPSDLIKPTKTLIASWNNFGGSIPETLLQLPSLVTLKLVGCGLTGAIPSWLKLTNFPYLSELWLGYNNLTGKPPAELASLQLTLADLSNNDLQCPDENIFPSGLNRSCDIHGNWMCGEYQYTVTCPTIPEYCRATPCKLAEKKNEKIISTGCQGIVQIAEQPVRVYIDTCFPTLIMGLDDVNNMTIKILELVDGRKIPASSGQHVFHYQIPTSSVQWTIRYEEISTPNNTVVPYLVYDGELSTGAKVHMPVWIFENTTTLRIFDRNFTLDDKTVKFGIDIRDWISVYAEEHGNHKLGVQFDVHSDVPFTLDPAFLQALLTDVDLVVNKTDTARELKFTVCSPPPPASNCVTTRFPLYGQTDGRIDIGGSLFINMTHLAELLAALTSGGTINGFTFHVLMEAMNQVSYDPDLSMLFGSTSKLQPANQDDDIQSQGVSQYAVPVGISIAVVVVVLAIVVYLIIRRKRIRGAEERHKIQEKVTTTMRTMTSDPPQWKRPERPREPTNVVY